MKKVLTNGCNMLYSSTLLLILIGGGSELLLRELYGLANAPLYFESDKFEYMAKPNQDGYRFGNHYHYNSYSQRSDEPDTTKTIVLGLGDSVLFGGVMIDQDSIATSIFTRETGMQMLNISAGSWSADNCAAYLNEYGTFGAKAMVLLCSSHDAHDNMDFQKVVGKHIAYPDKQHWCAWAELIDRYVWPRIVGYFKQNKDKDPDQAVLAGTNINKGGVVFNTGFASLDSISKAAGIPFAIILHADQDELAAGEYNEQGKEIEEWAKDNNVPLYKELNYGFETSDYRDGIHTSASGQRKEAELMKLVIKNLL